MPRSVRDIAFAASGLLNEKVGGPSVYPPAPAFLFLPPASYGPKTWNEDQGPDRYRRALYTFRFRSVAVPDAAGVRRAERRDLLRSAGALQHSASSADHAERAAVRRSGAGAGAARIERGRIGRSAAVAYAFRSLLSRDARSRKEQDVLLNLLQKQKQRFDDGWLSAQ